jgi:hypothetical protein
MNDVDVGPLVRAVGIARRTLKRESPPYTRLNIPFLFIKLLRKYIKSNLLSFILLSYNFQGI